MHGLRKTLENIKTYLALPDLIPWNHSGRIRIYIYVSHDVLLHMHVSWSVSDHASFLYLHASMDCHMRGWLVKSMCVHSPMFSCSPNVLIRKNVGRSFSTQLRRCAMLTFRILGPATWSQLWQRWTQRSLILGSANVLSLRFLYIFMAQVDWCHTKNETMLYMIDFLFMPECSCTEKQYLYMMIFLWWEYVGL